MDNLENLETGNTRRRKTKQKHNTIFVGDHYMKINTNNINLRHVPRFYCKENS